MSMTLAILLFVAALVLSVSSSIVLSGDIDRVGARFNLSEGLLGLLTALGANSPEISTAVVAIVARNHEMGLGVIIGSNIYNLASLLGLSAVVAGKVRIGTQGLILNGAIAIAITAVAVALVLCWISPAMGLALVLLLMVPYALLIALRPGSVRRYFGDGAIGRFFEAALVSTQQESRKDKRPRRAMLIDALSILPALATIVLASYGMVKAATTLGHDWGISNHVIGVIILASLTGLPNVLAAVRLALHGRGSAVVSEALNSNGLNVLAGICLPTLLLGAAPSVSTLTSEACWWMLGLTVLAVVLTLICAGLRRWEGALIILLYGVFVTMVIW